MNPLNKSTEPRSGKSWNALALLDGVKVLDLTQFLAGPYGSSSLVQLGAEVIKVEDPDYKDEARKVGSERLCEDLSLYFASLNWGKRSLALSMASEGGREVIKELVRSSDVIINNFRIGTLEKIHLDEGSIRTINPTAVTCTLTGFGETGPLADQPGYDYTVQALAGVMSLSGEPGGPPGKAGISYVDHIGGITLALAVCAGLVQKQRTGEGCHIDLSLFDTQISMLSYLAAQQMNVGSVGERLANGAHSSLVPAQLFRASDGYIVIFVGNDKMWDRLVRVLNESRLEDSRYRTNAGRLAERKEVVRLLSEVLEGEPTEYWVQLLSASKVACSKVNSINDALANPQVVSRQLIRLAENSAYGSYNYVSGPIPSVGKVNYEGAPKLGQHSKEILMELGYSREEVDNLVSSGAVFAVNKLG